MDLIVCILLYLGYTVLSKEIKESRKVNTTNLEVKLNPFLKENDKAFMKQFMRTYGREC